ncbi:MAG: hypothetical protein FWE16_04500 [Firmicutes bacterium]|nr:hypothetical protein [Bacillota bacterium]
MTFGETIQGEDHPTFKEVIQDEVTKLTRVIQHLLGLKEQEQTGQAQGQETPPVVKEPEFDGRGLA